MAGNGPAPTPRAVLRARGSRRGQAAGAEVTLPPALVLPPPPTLSVKASEVWRRVMPQLTGAGVLADVDVSVLEQFCTSWVHWQAAVADVEANGVTMEQVTREGFPRKVANPAVSIEIALSVELRQLGDRLGLSPSARARLKAPESAPGGGWADDEPRASTGGA